jgi:hypothetical protein
LQTPWRKPDPVSAHFRRFAARFGAPPGGYSLDVGYRAGTRAHGEQGGVEVVGAPGWVYAHPFAVPRDVRRGQRVRARRDDGLSVSFALPGDLQGSDDLHRVTRLVIEARERMERARAGRR